MVMFYLQYVIMLLINYTKLAIFLSIGQGWEETVVKQEQSGDGESEMKILLPSMPSLYILSFLFRACEEVHRIGGHVLDKTIFQKFALSLSEKVSDLPGHPVLLSISLFPPFSFHDNNINQFFFPYSNVEREKKILLALEYSSRASWLLNKKGKIINVAESNIVL